MLDVNELAAGESFMALGVVTVSDDGALLAYSTDTTGFRQYTLHIKDLQTGKVLADRAERVGSVVWAADSATLFYSVEDEETKRQHQLYRHTVGSLQSEDALVYEETDERFNLGCGRTRDGQYLVLESASPYCERRAVSGCAHTPRKLDADRTAPRRPGILCRPP